MSTTATPLSFAALCQRLGIGLTTGRKYLKGYKGDFTNRGKYKFSQEEIPLVVEFIEANRAAQAEVNRLARLRRVQERAALRPRFYTTGALAKKAEVGQARARRFVHSRNGSPTYPRSWLKFDADELEKLASELRALKGMRLSPQHPVFNNQSQRAPIDAKEQTT